MKKDVLHQEIKHQLIMGQYFYIKIIQRSYSTTYGDYKRYPAKAPRVNLGQSLHTKTLTLANFGEQTLIPRKVNDVEIEWSKHASLNRII